MVRTMNALTIALLCGAMLVGGVFGDQCSERLVENFESNDGEFGAKMIACLAEDAAEDCCAQVQELFAANGDLDHCLCDSDFYTMALDSVSSGGYSAESIVDMWEQCGVPVVGSEACAAEEDTEEPQVKAQLLLLKKKLIAKKLAKKAVKKAVIAKALALKAKALKKPVAKPVVAKEAAKPVTKPVAVPAGKKKAAAPQVVAAAPKKAAPAVVTTVPAAPVAVPAAPVPVPAAPVPAAPVPVPAAPVVPTPTGDVKLTGGLRIQQG